MSNKESTQEKLLLCFYEHLLKIKTFHFQTTNYGAHKASDEYIVKFLANMDRFMEVSQGIGNRGKITNSEISINFTILNDQSITGEIDKFVELMNTDSSFFTADKDLAAIRDEMVADANQFKYLLTFK